MNHYRKRHFWHLAAVALLALFAAPSAQAIVFQTAAEQTAGLGAGQSFLNAEAELVINLSGVGQVGCSGSLIAGGAYVLTAAHCVTGDTDQSTASSINIDFTNAGLDVTATNYIVDPVWNGSLSAGGDLALIKLSTPVTSIAGYQLDTSASAVGQVVTITGYGETGTGTAGAQSGTFGTLYDGTTRIDGVYSTAPTVYDYTFASTGRSNQAIIAPGDSGGAALLDVDGTQEIVGVNDFVACDTNGCTPNASFGDTGGETSVYANAAFLDGVLDAPEPASVAVFGIGTAVLAAVRRRRARVG